MFKNKRDALKESNYFIDHDLTEDDVHAAKIIRDVCRGCSEVRVAARKGFNAEWMNNTKYSLDPLLCEFSLPLPTLIAGGISSERAGGNMQSQVIGSPVEGGTSCMKGVVEQRVSDEVNSSNQQPAETEGARTNDVANARTFGVANGRVDVPLVNKAFTGGAKDRAAGPSHGPPLARGER